MTRNYIDVRKSVFKKSSKDKLIGHIINNELNDFISKYADDEEHAVMGGKFIPYIGWYWRDTDFYSGNISIGNCGEFIGIMENNKWDYPERVLTTEEVKVVVDIVCTAMEFSRQGGIVGEIKGNTINELAKLWDLFQTFKI